MSIQGGQGRDQAEIESDALALLSVIGWTFALWTGYLMTIIVRGWMPLAIVCAVVCLSGCGLSRMRGGL